MRTERTSVQHRRDRGIAMVALLVALTIMGIMLSVALPAWTTESRREKEAELIFRGEQYARAISLFQRKYANASPPTVDILVTERFLRKKYVDPVTGGDFELLTPGTALPGSNTPGQLQGGRAGAAATQGRGGSIATTSGLGRTTGAAAGGTRGTNAQTQPQTTGGRTGSTSGFSPSSFTVSPAFGGATLGITGVRSKSKDKSLREYNGADTYDQWLFLATQATSVISSPTGGQAPGGGAGRGQPPGAGGRGGQAPTGARGVQQGGRGGRGDTGAQRGGAPRGGGAGGGATGGFGGGGFGGGRGGF